MERTDVREPGGGEEPATTDMADPAWIRGRAEVGGARRPEVRRLRTVVSRFDLRQLLYLGRFRKYFSLVKCDFDCAESGDTCDTKLDRVAVISTIESELVRENKVKRFLWQQSRSYVAQLITTENPGSKSAKQSPRSLIEYIFTLCTKEKSVLGAEKKRQEQQLKAAKNKGQIKLRYMSSF